jgi:hypothetical protein
MTGDCDEEQSVIQPSRTLEKYISTLVENKKNKIFQDTLLRYTTSHKKFGTLYPLSKLFYYLAINVSI